MAGTSKASFNKCCRLCLSDSSLDGDLKSIFDESCDRTLQVKISISLGVEIRAGDKLSTIVCPPCISKIDNWQSYKVSCKANQSKLQEWLKSTTPATEGAILIKEEPIDHDTSPVVNGETSPMKNESVEEEFASLPPPLTPHNEDGNSEVDVEVVDQPDDAQIDPKQCRFCGKILSSPSNRKKHEKFMHGAHKVGDSITESDGGSLSQDDRSQSSIDSQSLNQSASSDREPTAEEKKILFAAGLKLLQRNSSPPISQETLSRMENSYIAKCKAMVTMQNTLRCACHNALHPNLKGLLSHLRALRIWFPVFTCYHCMITFTDRSSSTKHYTRCPKADLETLVKLSNLKKRSEVKTRLYQNYKCTQCKFMYSFHEDFCIHVDEDHSDITLPYTCTCSRVFNSLEDYKDHAYISCLVEFYCDICFVTCKTLDAFQKHAAENHDNSEGFLLLQEDNYKPRKFPSVIPVRPKSDRTLKREYTDESNIISGKRERRSSLKPPVLESAVDVQEKKEKLAAQRIPGTVCPICLKEYSSNNNMWRHYKTHLENEEVETQSQSDDVYDDSLYCCPDCGGMFSSQEWEQHKTQHKKKTCNECGKVFQFQSELDQHRSVHLNLKLYRDSKTQNYKSTMASPNGEGTSNVVVMCEICDRMFTTKEQLKEHKATHETMPVLENSVDDGEDNKNKKFYCADCDKHYSGYGGLWDHNKKKHPGRGGPQSKEFPKQCKYCDKLLFTGASYFMHKQMHERQFNLQKQRNLINDDRESSVSQEGNEDDDSESYHTCKRCFKVFSTRCSLKNHMKSHGINTSPNTKATKKGGKKVWCNICHCAFENQMSLEKHKLDGHGENDEMPNLSDEQELDLKAPFVFTCDVCVQTFTTKAGLKKHKEKHAREVRPILQKKPTLVYCKYCKISFENAMKLSNHMKEEHMESQLKPKMKEKNKTYSCKICRKIFTTAYAMYAHQGWHKRSTGKYANADNPVSDSPPLVLEPLLVIKQEKPDPAEAVPARFKCKTCNAVLPNNTALQIHILEKHRNVNAFVLPARCTMCNLDFGTQDEYDQHKKFHKIVERPQPAKQHPSKESIRKGFPCLHCPAAFSRIDTLKAHIRQNHREFVPTEFKCSQCDRVFDKQNSLSIHLKVHEKQKMTVTPVSANVPSAKPPLYCCSICNVGFDLPKDLRAHTIQAHPF